MVKNKERAIGKNIRQIAETRRKTIERSDILNTLLEKHKTCVFLKENSPHLIFGINLSAYVYRVQCIIHLFI